MSARWRHKTVWIFISWNFRKKISKHLLLCQSIFRSKTSIDMRWNIHPKQEVGLGLKCGDEMNWCPNSQCCGSWWHLSITQCSIRVWDSSFLDGYTLCMSVCLYVSACLCISLHVSACLCISLHVSACLCISLYVSVYLCMSLYVSVCLCISLYISACLCMSLYISVCLCISLHVSVCLCISLYVSVYLCISLHVSVCLSLSVGLQIPTNNYTDTDITFQTITELSEAPVGRKELHKSLKEVRRRTMKFDSQRWEIFGSNKSLFNKIIIEIV